MKNIIRISMMAVVVAALSFNAIQQVETASAVGGDGDACKKCNPTADYKEVLLGYNCPGGNQIARECDYEEDQTCGDGSTKRYFDCPDDGASSGGGLSGGPDDVIFGGGGGIISGGGGSIISGDGGSIISGDGGSIISGDGDDVFLP